MTHYFNMLHTTCYTQNPGCSDPSQSIPLAKAWEARNVDRYLEIKGPSFYMLSIHMCIFWTLICPWTFTDQSFLFIIDSLE